MMPQPDPVMPQPEGKQAELRDLQGLKLLMIMHFVIGGLVMGDCLATLLHMFLAWGLGMPPILASDLMIFRGLGFDPDAGVHPWVMTAFVFVVLVGLWGSFMSLRIGAWLKQRRHWSRCRSMSVLQWIVFFPFGIPLGICTRALLKRQSIQALFAFYEGQGAGPGTICHPQDQLPQEWVDWLHLKLLMVFHYILGGFSMCFGAQRFVIWSIKTGSALRYGNQDSLAGPEPLAAEMPGQWVANIGLAKASIAVLAVVGGLLSIKVAKMLRDRRNWGGCRLWSRLQWLLLFPLGIPLGICTANTLKQTSVKKLFNQEE